MFQNTTMRQNEERNFAEFADFQEEVSSKTPSEVTFQSHVDTHLCVWHTYDYYFGRSGLTVQYLKPKNAECNGPSATRSLCSSFPINQTKLNEGQVNFSNVYGAEK